MDYTGKDRRKSKRLKVTFIVIYRVDKPLHIRLMIGDKEVHAIMQDLSEGGIAVLTNYNISVGTLLSINFILINENAIAEKNRVRPLHMDGEVRYSIPCEKGEYRLGIQFMNLPQEDRTAIIEFVRLAVPNKNPIA